MTRLGSGYYLGAIIYLPKRTYQSCFYKQYIFAILKCPFSEEVNLVIYKDLAQVKVHKIHR